jgi:hypothetical protein
MRTKADHTVLFWKSDSWGRSAAHVLTTVHAAGRVSR